MRFGSRASRSDAIDERQRRGRSGDREEFAARQLAPVAPHHDPASVAASDGDCAAASSV